VYAAAVRLAEALPLLPGVIISSVFPSVVNSREQGEAFFLARLQQLYALIAALGYAMALPISFLAPWLINLLFGPQYAGAAAALVVLSWAAVFSGIGMARSTYLNTENLARLHVLTVTIGCAANIGLNWVLIPRWGGFGAAVGSLVAYWLAAHGTCYLIPALRPTGAMISRALLRPKFW
jgi:O-antigen/teichoic acid export membrane protein